MIQKTIQVFGWISDGVCLGVDFFRSGNAYNNDEKQDF
jgi:hypothetical protein